MKIIGVTGSHRARFNNEALRRIVDHLMALESEDELLGYMESLSNGIITGVKNRETATPSNSELGLIAAGWKVLKAGVDFEAISLKDLFAESDEIVVETLYEKLLEADALILSGPVYFGDRSSLVQQFIDCIGSNSKLRNVVQGKLFGGIASGAKRNGGQETTLIYMILDMTGLGFLAVGNDSITTAQYGGTIHAGNPGSAHKDNYGMATAMGVGSRLGALVKAFASGQNVKDPKALFLILQDGDGVASRHVREALVSNNVDAAVIDLTGEAIEHCRACAYCPNEYTPDKEYACVINSGDGMECLHSMLLDNDVIIPVVLCREPGVGVTSSYQLFMERTRYLRRSDYALSNTLIAPLVFTELGVQESYHMRMITSLIRHHTIIHKPSIGYLQDGRLLNADQIHSELAGIFNQAGRVGAGKILSGSTTDSDILYQPVGYVLKNPDGNRLKQRKKVIGLRMEHMKLLARERLGAKDGSI